MFKKALKSIPLTSDLSRGVFSRSPKKNLQWIYLEALDNIKLQNICSYADAGVNRISIGSIYLLSTRAIDRNLEIT